MMSEEELRMRNAAQESGHAVMAYLEGEKDRIARITIQPDVEAVAAGSIFFDPPFFLDSEEEARRTARIFLAGLNAEYFACQKHYANSDEQWDSDATFGRVLSDTVVVERAFERLNLSQEERLAFQLKVSDSIHEPHHFHAVEKLAAALLEKETLTGDEVRAILEGALLC